MGVTVGERGSSGGERERRGREALRPLIRPAGVGALLGVGGLLVAALPWDMDDFCRSEEPWGCLGFSLGVFAAIPVVCTLLGGVLLRAVGVRPAWRVAALGGLLAVLAVVLNERAGVGSIGGLFAAPLLLAGAYAAAAAVVLPRTASRRRWAVLAGVLLLMWPLTGVLSDYRVSDRKLRELAASRVPLLAPDVDGYRLYFPSADEYSGRFTYLLLPTSVKPSADDRERRGVWVAVAPQVAGFAPPGACESESSSGRTGAGPCEQVAPDTWRSSHYDSTRYIARRQGVIAVFSTQGPSVSDSDLRAMAASLSVRSPGFFVDE
ncbi:hypothetical protein ACFWC9_06140 [Streptomyces goshikiensis]|uniref:hypothetical protein n=1 Tax=Streptomyces goshikiensis TaxID=1942 RepID=UPI0036AB157D